MKKVGLFITVLVAVIWACDSNDASMQKKESNKVNAKNLKEFYNNYGLKSTITEFDASTQTTVTLPKGTILEIPYGAFTTDGNSIYYGIVKIVAREFTKVSEMAMSNFQTVDNNGNLLVTGGSFQLVFIDANNNKLFLNESKTIQMRYPAKIESSYKNQMDVYTGNFIQGDNQNERLLWTLNQNENVTLNNNYYEYTITPLFVNGDENLSQKQYCHHLPFDSNAWRECMGLPPVNWDKAFWEGNAVPFEVRVGPGTEITEDFLTGVMVFPGNQPGVTNLIFEGENNRFTTASTNIENVGAITIAAFSIENGEFRYSIVSSDTGIGSITLELQSGSVEEFNNQISQLVD